MNGLMKTLGSIVKRVPDYIMPIPFGDKVEVLVKRGDNFKAGDTLFKRMTKRIVESHHIPTQLGVKVGSSGDYIARLNGEFVEKGEVLAERLVSGGLIIKRINALSEGILSLDRLASGYIDIMSSTQEKDIVVDFRGTVEGVDSNNGMYLRSNAWVMKIITSMKSSEDDLKSTFAGEFVQIGDGSSVYTSKDLHESYHGEIVYAGRFVYPDLIRELYRRGAELVVAYAMDYEDYSMLTEPVVLLGGFGSVVFDGYWQRAISAMFGSFSIVNLKRREIAWGERGQFMNKTVVEADSGVVSEVKVGVNVMVISVDGMNRVGIVREVVQEGFATVEFEDRSSLIIDIAFLRPIIV